MTKYFKCVLERRDKVGTDYEERELNGRVMGLQSAAREPLVQFLYPVLNGLISLLVRHTLSQEAAAKVQQNTFATLAHIAKLIQTQLDLPCDKHGHNITLSTYLQHVLVPPMGQSSQAPFESKYATMGLRASSTSGGVLSEKEKLRGTASVRLSNNRVLGMHVFNHFCFISYHVSFGVDTFQMEDNPKSRSSSDNSRLSKKVSFINCFYNLYTF